MFIAKLPRQSTTLQTHVYIYIYIIDILIYDISYIYIYIILYINMYIIYYISYIYIHVHMISPCVLLKSPIFIQASRCPQEMLRFTHRSDLKAVMKLQKRVFLERSFSHGFTVGKRPWGLGNGGGFPLIHLEPLDLMDNNGD